MRLSPIQPSCETGSRRDFLTKLTAVGSAAALTTLPGYGLASELTKTSDRKEPYKLGTCDWGLKTPLTTDSFHTAKNIGLTGLQYSFGLKGEGLDLREKKNRETIRQTVSDTGVSIASLGIAVLNKLPYATHDDSQQIVIDCIESMAALKAEAAELEDRELAGKVAPNIVLLGFFGKGDINGQPDLIAKVIQRLKHVAPIAEQHGLTLGIESLLDEADHRRIMDGVGSSAIKVYYDTANSHGMGYDIYREMESLGSENICQIHCKEKKQLLGHGPIDFNRVRDIIESIGYHDWLIIEGSVPKKMNIETACKQNTEYLNSLVNANR